MLRLRNIAYLMAAAAMFTLISAPAPAADSSSLKIGVVDLERVYKNAPRVQQYMDELKTFSEALNAKLDIRAKNMMTDEKEIAELIDLKTKPNPTDADKARIQVLASAAQAKDDEFKALQQVKEPSDVQKARLKELQDMQKKSQQAGEAIAKDYYGQSQSKGQDLAAKADVEVQAAVTKVAEAKALPLVLAKRLSGPNGESLDFVLYGGIDITDDIIGKLDRKTQ